MITGLSNAASRRVRTVILLLIFTVVCVPPLIRATDSFKGGPTSPLRLRLNRGFDVPQSKWRVAPPTLQPAPVASVDETVSLRIIEPARPVEDALLVPSPYHASPDVLRGPPARLIL